MRTAHAPLFITALGLAVASTSASEPSWQPWSINQYQSIYGFRAHGDTLLAAVDGGVKRSVDWGIHWSEVGAGMSPDRVTGLGLGGNRLWACQRRTLYSSEDGGRNWAVRDSIDAGTFLRFIERGDTLYAYYSLFGKEPADGVLYSANGGLSWKDMPADAMLDPEPFAFGTDTITVSGTALLRKARGDWDTLFSLREEITYAGASNPGLIVCSGRICMQSADGIGRS